MPCKKILQGIKHYFLLIGVCLGAGFGGGGVIVFPPCGFGVWLGLGGVIVLPLLSVSDIIYSPTTLKYAKRIKETKPTIKNPKEYPLKILVNLSWIGILNSVSWLL